MKREDIISAYIRIREIDNTIPDEVLDFMKDAALSALDIKQTITKKIIEYKAGDKAQIIGCASGHYFKNGEIVTRILKSADTDTDAAFTNGDEYWYVVASDLMPIE